MSAQHRAEHAEDQAARHPHISLHVDPRQVREPEQQPRPVQAVRPPATRGRCRLQVAAPDAVHDGEHSDHGEGVPAPLILTPGCIEGAQQGLLRERGAGTQRGACKERGSTTVAECHPRRHDDGREGERQQVQPRADEPGPGQHRKSEAEDRHDRDKEGDGATVPEMLRRLRGDPCDERRTGGGGDGGKGGGRGSRFGQVEEQGTGGAQGVDKEPCGHRDESEGATLSGIHGVHATAQVTDGAKGTAKAPTRTGRRR
ncbi:hypothetical protein GCM10025876_10310 [Demequina litorisediminis]|uniref:Uncharacterized protein n=1 Tax=Demequina litorisediminis TaxID=1849022 RepID=A0ABQ6IAE8_9MICO|nr:hypothetical protein GCM10025876_10310 [Demequina litorisediminis]